MGDVFDEPHRIEWRKKGVRCPNLHCPHPNHEVPFEDKKTYEEYGWCSYFWRLLKGLIGI